MQLYCQNVKLNCTKNGLWCQYTHTFTPVIRRQANQARGKLIVFLFFAVNQIYPLFLKRRRPKYERYSRGVSLQCLLGSQSFPSTLTSLCLSSLVPQTSIPHGPLLISSKHIKVVFNHIIRL